MPGVLEGLRIVEVGGVGPTPFACMMLADHGAQVIRIESPGDLQSRRFRDPANDILVRSRTMLQVDLKQAEGVDLVRRIASRVDGLVEGFRPGVMEGLELGPEPLLEANPSLVYGRMTGWGQTGPLARAAGHDINYIALAGALHGIGTKEAPIPPLNLVGDFGGGGMLLAFGMVSAMLAVQRGGKGQVVDCAMTEGVALLMSMIWSFRAMGEWHDERASNFLDGAAPFYGCYETSDGKWISIAPIEPQFYAIFREKLGLADDADFDDQFDDERWPALKARLGSIFLTRTRDQWCALLEKTDVCFAPVLSMQEAPGHPHNRSRRTFIVDGDFVQPAPAPRFSATAPPEPRMTTSTSTAVLADFGYAPDEISALTTRGIVG